MTRTFPWLGGLTAALLLTILGCGSESTPPVPAIPNTPDGTVRTVAASLSQHQPGVIWAALPASYQNDVNDLIGEFTSKVDRDMYDRSFEVLAKLGDVMSSKKQFILNSPLLADAPFDKNELSQHWDSAVDLISTVNNSDLRSVDSLRKMDVGRFLNTTGSKVMSQSVAIAEALGEDEDVKQLHELKDGTVELVSSDSGNAVVRFSLPNGFTEDMQLTQVEGKWIPMEMAGEWQQAIAEIKSNLANMTAPESKMQYMTGLAAIDAVLTSLQNTQTQQEFDEAIGGAMGMLMGF